MKKILLSLSILAFVGVVVVGATGAWFTNTETSQGNTFTAGIIDLKVDNDSYVTDSEGKLIRSESTSWDPSDLLGKYFFKFSDLKPGDVGEDTISLHVQNNPAWACLDITVTETPENGQTTPESLVDNSTGVNEGELQNELNFVFWKDDGDNVLEQDEVDSVFWQKSIADISNSPTLALADSEGGVLESGVPLTPGEDYYIGKAWCQGKLTLDAAPQDGTAGTNSPLQDTGIDCDGSDIGNASQTDGVVADVEFSVTQSRHNERFLCNPPQEGTLTLIKEVSGGSLTKDDFDLFIDDGSTAYKDGDVVTVSAGVHNVSEGSYSDYNLTYGADCPNGQVTVPANGDATCTLINTYNKGTLTVNKVVTNDNGGNEDVNSFNLFIDGAAKSFGTPYTLAAGSHVVSETGASGYSGTYSGDCDQNGNVNVPADGDAVCTITNADIKPIINLTKVVDNTNGGTLGPQDFVMQINGITIPSGLSKDFNSNLALSITESTEAGYTFTSITGDAGCPTSLEESFTLDEGESLHCTITNTYTGL